MENPFRRPLSNLKFMRPVQKNNEENNLKENFRVKKSSLKPTCIPQSSKGLVMTDVFDESTENIAKPVTTKSNELIDAKLALPDVDEIISEPNVEDESSNNIPAYVSSESNNPNIPDAVTETAEIVSNPVVSIDNFVQVIPEPVYNASTLYAELHESITVDAVHKEQTESTAITPRDKSSVNHSKSDVSTMTTEYYSYESISKLFEQRDGWLMQQVDILVNSKLPGLVTQLVEENMKKILQTTEPHNDGHVAEGNESGGTMATTTLERGASGASQHESGTTNSQRKVIQSVIPAVHFDGSVVRFPFQDIPEAEDFNLKLQEKSFLASMISHIVPFGGEGAKATLNIFNGIFSKELKRKFNWENKGTTIQSFPNILSLIHDAGRQIHTIYIEKSTNDMIKNTLRNARAKNKE